MAAFKAPALSALTVSLSTTEPPAWVRPCTTVKSKQSAKKAAADGQDARRAAAHAQSAAFGTLHKDHRAHGDANQNQQNEQKAEKHGERQPSRGETPKAGPRTPRAPTQARAHNI